MCRLVPPRWMDAAVYRAEVCYPYSRRHWRHCAVKRRELITLLGGAALAWPLAARAQLDGRVPLLGWLDAYDNSDTGFQSIRTALREALAKLGWIEGRNLKVEGRFGVADANRLRAAAVELVSLAPDVIVAGGAVPTRALQHA